MFDNGKGHMIDLVAGKDVRGSSKSHVPSLSQISVAGRCSSFRKWFPKGCSFHKMVSLTARAHAGQAHGIVRGRVLNGTYQVVGL